MPTGLLNNPLRRREHRNPVFVVVLRTPWRDDAEFDANKFAQQPAAEA